MSSLFSFSLGFQETFPTFPSRTYEEPLRSIFNTNDTRTIAILGQGRRRETLVRSAKGDQSEGEAANFDSVSSPSGRYFLISTFPVDPDEFKVYRGQSASRLCDSTEYLLDEDNGYLVLYYPLIRGEQLVIDYISTSDINTARGYLAEELQDLFAVYGSPSLDNSISAAAEIAFANGAPRVIVVQGDHTGSDPYWAQAYAALENQHPYMIVPMQNGLYGAQAILGMQHVQELSDIVRRRERILLIGEIASTETDDPNALERTSITDFNSEERVIFIAADKPVSVIGGESVKAEGGFLAAAVAGLWAAQEYIPQPISRKNITRIAPTWKNTTQYSESELRSLVDQGITLLALKGAVGNVYQFTTTIANGNPVDLEPSIWRIRDYVSINTRLMLENRFVGKPFVLSEKLGDIQAALESHLEGLISQAIITKFSGVRVEADPIEPRQADISFDIQPVFPLNKISVSVRVRSSF